MPMTKSNEQRRKNIEESTEGAGFGKWDPHGHPDLMTDDELARFERLLREDVDQWTNEEDRRKALLGCQDELAKRGLKW